MSIGGSIFCKIGVAYSLGIGVQCPTVSNGRVEHFGLAIGNYLPTESSGSRDMSDITKNPSWSFRKKNNGKIHKVLIANLRGVQFAKVYNARRESQVHSGKSTGLMVNKVLHYKVLEADSSSRYGPSRHLDF